MSIFARYAQAAQQYRLHPSPQNYRAMTQLYCEMYQELTSKIQ